MTQTNQVQNSQAQTEPKIKWNKKELAGYIANRSSVYHKYEIEDFLEMLIDAITEIAVEGEEIKIENLGHFTQRPSGMKRIYDFPTKTTRVVQGYPTLMFRVSPSLQKKIRDKVKADRGTQG